MGSSSKPKSSKKRRSKIHSQPRKMKKMKKSRSKSKKVTRRHDTSSDDSMSSQSISSASNDSCPLYSDSDSISVSFSSSSSEGTYRGRKKVSRVRSNLKSSRKRVVRRRSWSSESSEDLSCKKKRKRSRKNTDSNSRKKSRKHNKPRGDVRSSSASHDSYDCSTCKEESGSFSEESAVLKLRMKSREKKKHKRESREERVETKRRIHKSPSCSSYSRSRDQSYSVSRGEQNFIGESTSRRLRSVIIFADQAQKEGNELEKDSPKEEIIYDRDDYPSPRSNDSSGGGSKRDVPSRSPVTSGDKRQKENVEGEETCVSKHRVTEATESRKNADDQNVHDPFFNECETNKHEKESRTYAPLQGTNLGSDILEATLRQKALENLRNFRGGIQGNVKTTANQKNKDDGDANQSFCSKAEIVQRVLPKQDNTNVIDPVQMLDRGTSTTSVGEVSCPNMDIADRGNSGGIAKQRAIHPPDGLALSGNRLKEDNMTMQAVVESDSGDSFLRGKTSGMNSSQNQAMILQVSPHNKLTENMESERKIPPRATHSITPCITNNSEAGVDNASSSATVELASNEQSTSRGQGSNEEKTVAKDGSQFEQKTMSVMRGGEMVEVSYKVYIPKRAPALARRQLKR